MSAYGPSVRDMAERLGVSKTTVSLALKNSSKISQAMRERVTRLAEEMGYRPDPVLAKYMSHMQKKRLSKEAHALAVLMPMYGSLEQCRSNASAMQFLAHVQRRAREHGYNTEVYFNGEGGVAHRRLYRILRTRAYEGVVIGPHGGELRELELDLSSFSVATCMLPYSAPLFHRVEPDYYQDTLLMLDRLYGLGCRRMAVMVLGGLADYAHHLIESAYYYFVQTHRDCVLLQPYVSADFDHQKANVWLLKAAPEVVVSNYVGTANWLMEKGYGIPADVAFALLYVNHVEFHPSLMERYAFETFTGMRYDGWRLDAAVVDLVIAQIRRNERGVPELPQRITMRGVWQRGASVPERRASPTRSRRS